MSQNESIFNRLKKGLTKTKNGLVQRLKTVVSGHSTIGEDLYEEMEEVLISGDVGPETTLRLVDELKDMVRERRVTEPADVNSLLKEKIRALLREAEGRIILDGPLSVVMVVGVNGVGKTTLIGKLAYRWKCQGQRVLLAAADTFRAAAIEQLEVWGQRAGADVIRHAEGSDPAAVVFDSIKAAQARGAGVVIVDTAGRLHTKRNLMEELKKIRRVIEREAPGALKEVLLVVDATTGQNAVQQARFFHDAVGVTGIALTKLDGTARGGIIIAISSELGLPVKLVGVGERVDDLQDFDADQFVNALFD